MKEATVVRTGAPFAFPQLRSRNLTQVSSLTPAGVWSLLDLAEMMKEAPSLYGHALRGQTIACIFEKPSTRTRVSFAAAAARLGATPIALSPQELQIGRGESIADTARSLSGYCAAIVIRTFSQDTVEELAEWATVPVINALSDEHHPCQALADAMTIREHFGELAGRRVAFVGDGRDNVAHSLLETGALTGLDVVIGCPPEREPDRDVLMKAEDIARWTGANLFVLHDPVAAVMDADAVYTDVWTSMGEEEEESRRRHLLEPFRVTEELMRSARPDAIFLHCLPAKRGQEVSAAVIDGEQSVVWQQSANRLPIEAALLLALAGDVGRTDDGPE